jgi:hypothetical protein
MYKNLRLLLLTVTALFYSANKEVSAQGFHPFEMPGIVEDGGFIHFLDTGVHEATMGNLLDRHHPLHDRGIRGTANGDAVFQCLLPNLRLMFPDLTHDFLSIRPYFFESIYLIGL